MTSDNTRDKIEKQREGGRKLGNILQKLLQKAQVGVSLMDIEKEAQQLIEEAGGTPSFQTVGGYRWATCLCIDDDVVHGIPTEYELNEGDLLTIDVGLLYKGYHTDTAWTKIVGSGKQEETDIKKFLTTGEQALWESISEAKAGRRIGHISQAIQTRIEGAGYSIVKALVGHAVGKELHEKPQIPGYLSNSIEQTPLLTDGMTIAIEVIYAQGMGAIVYANDDGWTLSTKDGSLSAVFEHTILVNGDVPEVLTRGYV
jgi:methionyl aminopeptidase